MAGTVALAVAAGGAVTASTVGAGATTDGANVQSFATTGAVNLTGGAALVTDRQRAISRDSARDAERDAANKELEKNVETQARQRNAALSSLAKSAEEQADKIEKNLWVLPTKGYRLTARFGMAGGLWSSNHTGLDFAAPSGTPIVAVANGTVTETGWAGAYGNRTIMTLDDGTEIWYNHQSSISVQAGDIIRGGQQIGTVGSTGNTTGPHLHLEVRPGGGDPVDPYKALVAHGLQP